jgi:hypothetical protein
VNNCGIRTSEDGEMKGREMKEMMRERIRRTWK